MAECEGGCEDRNECKCQQDCVDCHQSVHLWDDHEWPEGEIRCWGCAEQRAAQAIELLKKLVDCEISHVSTWNKYVTLKIPMDLWTEITKETAEKSAAE